MKKSSYATLLAIEHKHGNITEVTLKMPPNFNFVAGQYITVLLPDLKNKLFREQFRDFSITSPPEQLPLVRIAYRQSDSLFKQTLSNMALGSNIEVDGPAGDFVLPPHTKPLVFIAGGIGITPFFSMIQSNPSYRSITIMHFNKNKESAPKYPFLATLLNIKYISYLERPSVEHFSAHVNKNMVAQWYIAGPPAMVDNVRETLIKLGTKPTMIKTEEFSGYEETE